MKKTILLYYCFFKDLGIQAKLFYNIKAQDITEKFNGLLRPYKK